MQTQIWNKKTENITYKMEKNIEEKSTENVSFVSKSEMFIEKNKNMILIVVSAIVIIILAFFGIRKFIVEPRQEKANQAMYAAEQYMAQGNFQMALYGDSTSTGIYGTGLLDVIKNYGSTKAGKRAKYEAGICYLRLGQYKEALKYFDKYNGNDQLTPIMNEMMKGDAEIELGNTSAALKHYKKAAAMDDNPITAPFALFKAGMVYLMDNQPQKAIECFQKVKDDYSESLFKSQMDGFIEYAKNL